MLFDQPEPSETHPVQGLVGISRSVRYWAAFFDQALAMICFFVLGSIAGRYFPSSRNSTIDVAMGVSVFFLYFGYFFVWEALFSATPGKMWYGLSVRHLDGTKCSVTAAFLRTMTRFIEVNPIMLGALPAIISIHCTERKQRIGDLLAGTVVVHRRSIP
jgi:uncharacterized RDD family membrane protein YckC